MDLTALALVVAAAFIHATWNLLSKKAAAGAAFVWCYSLASTVLYLPLAAWLLDGATHTISGAGWTVLVASGALHLGYNLMLQRGYQVGDLGVVYPVARGTGPLLSATGAFMLLGETTTMPRIIGMLLIVLGIFAIARVDRMFGAASRGPIGAAGYGAATGGFAGYTLADAYAVKQLLIAPLLVDYLSGVLRLLMLTPSAWMRRAEIASLPRSTWRYAVAVGAIAPLSYILVLTAMQRAPVSLVAPAREMSMLVAALMGTFLLGEGDAVRRLLGAALIAAGVVSLMWT